VPRRRAVTLAAAAAVALAACQGETRGREDVRAALADGVRAADSLSHLAATSPEQLDDVGVLALGYLERARLGLGSPFRLADAARDDQRLPPPLGRRLAWALLDAARRGATHEIDAAALADAPPSTTRPGLPPLADGAVHRAVVDSVVRAAPDARTGEGIVRLGYVLARAERLVGERVAASTVHAAALAATGGWRPRTPRRCCEPWSRAPTRTRSTCCGRGARRARCAPSCRCSPTRSAPTTPPWPPARSGCSSTCGSSPRSVPYPAAEPFVDSVAVVATADSATADSVAAEGTAPERAEIEPAPPVEPGLPAAVARRLAALPSVRSGYPSAALVVTLGGFRRDTYAPTPGQVVDETARRGTAARARLAARGRTEEALAAEWALVRATLEPDGAARRDLGALVAAAVVSTRPGNQAPVALPAPVATSAELLALRDGVREVSAAPDVPPEWRDAAAFEWPARSATCAPCSRRRLRRAVGAARGEPARRPRAGAARSHGAARLAAAAHRRGHRRPRAGARPRLAGGAHPARRARHLRHRPGGAQRARWAARRRRAHPRHGPPARRARARRRAAGAPYVDHDRPAERFARGADFLTAAALAREGRMNATLSSVQDEVLAGYAGVVAPEPGDGSAEALLDVTEAITPVPRATRAWFLQRFGAGARPGPLAAARGVLETTPDWGAERMLRAVGVPVALAQPSAALAARRVEASCGGAPEWRDRVRWLAADARARGVLRERALRAAGASWGGWSWQARALVGGPWRPDLAEPAVGRMRDALLRSAAADQRVRPGGCGRR
jgi:hypothetical protein